MLKDIMEDFQILREYMFKKFLQFSTSFLSMILPKSKRNNKNFNILLELDGASKLGGEFLGERFFYGCPTTLYRLKRQNSEDKKRYFYVAYIKRKSGKFQFIMEEEWDRILNKIPEVIKSNERVSINLRSKEGGGSFVTKRGNLRRKKL